MKRQVIVVEGKNDYSRIKQLYPNAKVITTNGSDIRQSLIDDLLKISKNHEIVLLLDPDYPGERIRKSIAKQIPQATHVFVAQKDAISKNKKKVGIEHVDLQLLKNYLMYHHETNYQENIGYEDVFEAGLVGKEGSKQLRVELCKDLQIGYVNGKQLANRLNLFNIQKEDIVAWKEKSR